MKSKIIPAMVMLLCVGAPVCADLMLYTFSGNTYVYPDISNPDVSPYRSVPVTYRFLVDVEQPGILIDIAGEQQTFTSDVSVKTSGDTTVVSAMQYFYAELIDGALLNNLTVGDNSRSMVGVNVAYSKTPISTGISTSGTAVFLNGGKISHSIMLFNENTPSFENWVVGTRVTGYEFSNHMNLVTKEVVGSVEFAISSLRLISIEAPVEPPANVPEPTLPLLLLWGTAPLLLVGLRKRH